MNKYYCVYGKKDSGLELLGLSESETVATDYGGALYEKGHIRDIKMHERSEQFLIDNKIDMESHKIIEVDEQLTTVEELFKTYETLKKDLSAYESAKANFSIAFKTLRDVDYSMSQDISIMINATNVSIRYTKSKIEKAEAAIKFIKSGIYFLGKEESNTSLMNVFLEASYGEEK